MRHSFLFLLLSASLGQYPVPVHSLFSSWSSMFGGLLQERCEFNSASSPSCWGDFDLSTNYYEHGPDTGVIREYWFDVVNSTMAPDGVERMALSINGSIPGPTIIADWGDTIVVHVHNALENNGTSLHFHGVRQNYTSHMDGVSAITQCPVTPGQTMTYRFKATQYGTSWYHSHFQIQAWNGIFGGLIINGPTSAPYDEDLGTLILSDWFHQPVDQLLAGASAPGSGPPVADNGLINGTNVLGDPPVGKRFEMVFKPGVRYRIRLVNGAIDTMFRFMIDGHNLTVMSTDFVPIHPYTATSINIAIGQRYDLVVTADASGGQGSGPAADGGDGGGSGGSGGAPSFWLRAIPVGSCGSDHENAANIMGIVHYDLGAAGGAAGGSSRRRGEPKSKMWSYLDECTDEDPAYLVPSLPVDVGEPGRTQPVAVGLRVLDGFYKWTLNGDMFRSNWRRPTIQRAIAGNNTWEEGQQVVELPQSNEWVYFVVENSGLDHPLHLHGHDVHILAQDIGNYTDAVKLNRVNPPRRDVAMLPANGFLVLAFRTDNPGVWLMHCHIGWHSTQGFALQLVERMSEITANTTLMGECCQNWEKFAKARGLRDDGSGL